MQKYFTYVGKKFQVDDVITTRVYARKEWLQKNWNNIFFMSLNEMEMIREFWQIYWTCKAQICNQKPIITLFLNCNLLMIEPWVCISWITRTAVLTLVIGMTGSIYRQESTLQEKYTPLDRTASKWVEMCFPLRHSTFLQQHSSAWSSWRPNLLFQRT